MRLVQVFAPRNWAVGKPQVCGHCPSRSGRRRVGDAAVESARVGGEVVEIEVRMYAWMYADGWRGEEVRERARWWCWAGEGDWGEATVDLVGRRNRPLQGFAIYQARPQSVD